MQSHLFKVLRGSDDRLFYQGCCIYCVSAVWWGLSPFNALCAANSLAAAGVCAASSAVRCCGQYETLAFVWLLMFQLQQLGSRPHQRWGWQRERAALVRTGWRCSHALLHSSRHPRGGAPLLGAGCRGVPRPGDSAGGGHAHAPAGQAPGLPFELHLCRLRRPRDAYTGTVDNSHSSFGFYLRVFNKHQSGISLS